MSARQREGEKRKEEEIKINGASETNYHRKQIKTVSHFHTQKRMRVTFY